MWLRSVSSRLTKNCGVIPWNVLTCRAPLRFLPADPRTAVSHCRNINICFFFVYMEHKSSWESLISLHFYSKVVKLVDKSGEERVSRGEGRFYGYIRVLRHDKLHRQKIAFPVRFRRSRVPAGEFLFMSNISLDASTTLVFFFVRRETDWSWSCKPCLSSCSSPACTWVLLKVSLTHLSVLWIL